MRSTFLTVAVCLGVTAPAAATPGAVDRSFGRDGRVTLPFDVVVASTQPLRDGQLAVLRADSAPGVSFFRGDGRRLPARPGSASSVALAILPDGRFVTQSLLQGLGSNEGEIVTRRRPDGSVDQAFGDAGRFTLVPGARIVAVSRAGRTVATRTSRGSTTLRGYRSDGTPDPAFAPLPLAGPVLAARFDHAGRLVVQSEAGALSRLLRDGRADPTFASSAVGTGELVLAPSGARTLVLAPAPFLDEDGKTATGEPTLLGADGQTLAVTAPVARALRAAQAATFDPAGRLLVSDGRGLRRASADGQRIELLRARLLRTDRARTTAIAVDGRGRILVGGYELLGDGFDPALTFDIAFEALTRNVLLRLQGAP